MPRRREKYWYALRVFKDMGRAREDFSRARIRTFVPYRVEEVVEGGLRYEERPLVESLIFIRASGRYVKEYWYEHFPDVMYYRDLGTGEPGRIGDGEMEAFRRVTSPLEAGVVFYETEGGADWRRGERVRVREGRFAGYEGNVVRIGRDRKVAVELLLNFRVVADIHPRFLERIK